jgi:hypothetical protein
MIAMAKVDPLVSALRVRASPEVVPPLAPATGDATARPVDAARAATRSPADAARRNVMGGTSESVMVLICHPNVPIA